MERLVAMMAFCEALLDGTVAPSGPAGYGASAAANKWPPMEKLVATMAFCEAPFDGTGTFVDGTSSPSSSGAAGGSSSASAANVPEAGGGQGAVAWLADAKKEWTLREHRLKRDKAGTVVVDGLAIFETVAFE